MSDSDDFAWPPPESEIAALEVVDLESGLSVPQARVSATALTEIPATRADAAPPAPVRSAARGPAPSTAPDFTWPPVGDPHDAIVLFDATLDGGSPWAPAAEQDRFAEADTIVTHRPSHRHAPNGWTRWAAVLLLCAAGGALLQRHLHTGLSHTGLVRVSAGNLAPSTGEASHASAPWGRDRASDDALAARTGGGALRDGTYADVRLPRGFGDLGTSRPVQSEGSAPTIVRTAASRALSAPPPAAMPGASSASLAAAPALIGSTTSLSMPSLALAAEPRLSMHAPVRPAIEMRPAADEARIEATLDRYRTAYASLDAAAARSVWPSVDTRALERAFGSLKSQGLDFDGCKTDVQGPDATSTCRGRTTYVPRIGSQRPRTEEHQWRFQLRKVDESWLIVTADAS